MQPIPHTQREIRERREQILFMMSRGYSYNDIARELKTTRQTIHRDMRSINDMANKDLNNLARSTLPTTYVNCHAGLNEVLKECWRIYEMREEDQNDNRHPRLRLTWWHRIAALRLAAEVTFNKSEILVNGPAIMELRGLEDRVKALRNDVMSEPNQTLKASK